MSHNQAPVIDYLPPEQGDPGQGIWDRNALFTPEQRAGLWPDQAIVDGTVIDVVDEAPQQRYDHPTEQKPVVAAPAALPQRVAGESLKNDHAVLGGDSYPDWSYRSGQAPVDLSNVLSDSYSMAGEVGPRDVDDTQLHPEDGLRVGDDGRFHASNEPGSYAQPNRDAIMGAPVKELSPVVPRRIPVRNLGAGATALQVSTTGQATGGAYRSEPAKGTLYSGRLVGESYKGTRRISG